MRAPVTYWALVAALAFGISACASRELSTQPFVPGDAPAAGASLAGQSESEDVAGPDAGGPACYTAKAQPRWIFKGACKFGRVKRPGTIFTLPEYGGYTTKVRVPKNDAGANGRLRVVSANGSLDIAPYRGKKFPAYPKTFLYVQAENPGPPLKLRDPGLMFAVASDGKLGSGCGVATLNANDKWRALHAIVTQEGRTIKLRMTAAAYQRLERGPSYFALFCKTPAPAPSPTPTVQPPVTPTPPPTATPPPGPPPAYCSAYQTPAPNSGNNPVLIADNSGLPNAAIYLYVATGGNQYLATNGQLVTFTTGATPPPLPLVCYPGSTGGSGQTFELPAGSNGRLYIAYGPTPGPSNPSPNPMAGSIVGNSGGYTQPTVNQGAAGYVSSPWDFVEYTLPSGGIDVTQVDAVGLPIELTIGSQTVGVTSAGIQSVYDAFTAPSEPSIFKQLVVSTNFNGANVLARIINPSPAGQSWGFPPDYFYNQKYNPEPAAQSGSLGYLGYVLNKYQVDSYLYDLTPVDASYGYYCASSDGASQFIFTPVATPVCPGTPSGSPVTVPVSTLEASGASSNCSALILAQPYGTGAVPGTFPTLQQFYLWKAMTLDFNRGAMLSTDSHPVGGYGTGSLSVPFSSFYQDPLYDNYSQILHTYYLNHQAYANSYDEPGGLAAVFAANAPQPIQLTINKIPTIANPQPSPSAAPGPSQCSSSARGRRR